MSTWLTVSGTIPRPVPSEQPFFAASVTRISPFSGYVLAELGGELSRCIRRRPGFSANAYADGVQRRFVRVASPRTGLC